MEKKVVKTKEAPAAAGSYSQAVSAGGFVFISGQLPIDPDTGEMTRGDIGGATERVIGNIRGILEAAGVSLDDVVKITVYLRDMNDFAKMNDAYAAFFGKSRPARACIAAKELPKGADIEMDAIAACAKK